jgi:CBS domain-containing protein
MGELEKLRHCLALSRNARALVLRDAEAFHEASTALEHIGQVICGGVRNGLFQYEPNLIGLGLDQGVTNENQLSRLCQFIRTSRNSAVHDGAWARHVSVKLIEFLVILEDGIQVRMKKERNNNMLKVEDIMVRSPVVAETWQMVAHVRREMLTNSFSNLPIFWNGDWHVITDTELMQFLRSAVNHEEYKKRLNSPIESVLGENKISIAKAETCFDQQSLDDPVRIKSQPVLLVCQPEDKKRLVGILSAFDLL